MNVAIIGAGLIGSKRVKALSNGDSLLAACDINFSSAQVLAEQYQALFTDNYKEITQRDDIDVAIISVINKYTLSIATDMLNSGKHVLCEKPLGRNAEESHKIIQAALQSGKLIKTGFNHRFHPAIMKAKETVDNGTIGQILNVRARYGHGGRPGMEGEWRCSKELCGGGELIDQGVHLVDLCRWFVNEEVRQVYGKTIASFWQTEVEDNAFFHLEFKENILAQCHVSWTNWKNIFSFEVHGTKGYIKVEGLGKSYGVETLEIGYRRKEGGRPDIKHMEFPDNDGSWEKEWLEFKTAIKEKREPLGNGVDGYMANQVIDAIYESSASGCTVKIRD